MRPLANPTHFLKGPDGTIYAHVRVPRTTMGYAIQPVGPIAHWDAGTSAGRQGWGPSAHDDLMRAGYYGTLISMGQADLHYQPERWRGVFGFSFGYAEVERCIPKGTLLIAIKDD